MCAGPSHLQGDVLPTGFELKNCVSVGKGCEEQVGRDIEGNEETLETVARLSPTFNYFFLVPGLPGQSQGSSLRTLKTGKGTKGCQSWGAMEVGHPWETRVQAMAFNTGS